MAPEGAIRRPRPLRGARRPHLPPALFGQLQGELLQAGVVDDDLRPANLAVATADARPLPRRQHLHVLAHVFDRTRPTMTPSHGRQNRYRTALLRCRRRGRRRPPTLPRPDPAAVLP